MLTMSRPLHQLIVGTLLWGCCLSSAPELWALEKYGRPLPEMEGAHDHSEEHWVRGYLLTGAFLNNPSFAARPDNSGLVGLRHMVHLETDLYKEYLQFYTDQNFFSDRRAGWISLSEWDSVFAFTGAIHNWGWRLQYERDAPLDRSGTIQAYADTLVTYRPADARSLSWWRSAFPDQNLTVYAGGGWLFHNQTYFARPDNTGRALFRYVAHADLDLYRNRVVLFVDGNFFTDRSADNVLRPSEFDLVMGLAVRYQDMELALIHERDMPLDRGGLVQRYLALQLRYEFEWTKSSSPAGKQLSLHR
jgi:hypothetical protein